MDPHERKVKTICDALRAKNWKGAVKLANTALQKHKESDTILAFKAVALEKLGKTDEAFNICEEIHTAGTVDERVLHAMGMVYKSLERMDCLTAAYSKAVETKKNDLELMSGLFACYVRECAFNKQQQLAMKMHRTKGNVEKYLWWIVVSAVLQVWKRRSSESESLMGAEQTLKLAQSLAKRKIEATKAFSCYEALLLYVDILYTQNLGQEVLELLSSEMSATVCRQPIELKVLKAQCYLQLADDDNAATMLKDILTDRPDHWTCCRLLLELYLPQSSPGDNLSWQSLCQESSQIRQNLHGKESATNRFVREISIERAEEAYSFIQSKLNEMDEDSKATFQRTSALVDLEFAYRKHQNDLCCTTDLLEAIRDTYKKIGHLKSTHADLRNYIHSLDHESQDALASLILEEMKKLEEQQLNEANHEIASSLSTGYLTLSMLNVTSFSSERVSHSIHFCAKLAETDTKEATLDYRDTAILSAVNFLMTKSPRHTAISGIGIQVWESYILLRIASEKDPDNPQLTVSLALIAYLLGAPQIGTELLQRLEIKNAQLDSVASHLLYPFLRSYCWDQASRRFDVAAWQLFSTQKSDVEEMTYTAYLQDAYTKILEFVDFKDRLEMSHSFYLMRCESSIAETKTRNQSISTIESSILDKCKENPLDKSSTEFFHRLSFNEDLSVRPCWMPPFLGDYRLSVLEWWQSDLSVIDSWTRPNDVLYKKWKQCRISWLKIRWCIPHLLKRMWLLDDDPHDDTAIDIVLKEMRTTQEECLKFLKSNIHAWQTMHPNLTKLADAYAYFQCGVFWLGHVANVALMGEITEESVEEFISVAEFVDEFCAYVLGELFRRLESDLSCWVRTASAVFRAILSEEFIFIVYALQKWEKQIRSVDHAILKERLVPVLGGFAIRLTSILSDLSKYLKLIEEMDTKKVAQNIMLLMGIMEAKDDKTPFAEEIEGKDITALSVFMEHLNLADYQKCAQWDLFPSADVDAVEVMLREVFEETICWTQDLSKTAEMLLSSLATLNFKTAV